MYVYNAFLGKIIPCPTGVEEVSGERVETSLGSKALRMEERGECEVRRCAQTQLDLPQEVESSSPPKARDPCIQILKLKLALSFSICISHTFTLDGD